MGSVVKGIGKAAKSILPTAAKVAGSFASGAMPQLGAVANGISSMFGGGDTSGLGQQASNAMGGMRDAWGAGKSMVGGMWNNLKQGNIAGAMGSFGQGMMNMSQGISNAQQGFAGMGSEMRGIGNNMMNNMSSFGQGMMNNMSSMGSGMMNNLRQGNIAGAMGAMGQGMSNMSQGMQGMQNGLNSMMNPRAMGGGDAGPGGVADNKMRRRGNNFMMA